MISVLSATRRPEGYEKMVLDVESAMGSLICEHLAFVNNDNVRADFKSIASHVPKVKIVNAPENYIYRNGFDSIYNTLMKVAKGSHVLMLFDTDEVFADEQKIKDELESDMDIFGFQMYMQRGDSWEPKYQLYRNDGLVKWFGLVHENQQFSRQPKMKEISKDAFYVLHMNARDNASKALEKKDGIIVLEKTEEGTDSDERNLLYESLTWKIIHENGRHMHKAWFEKHYSVNQSVIDWYHERAVARWGE